MYNDERTPDQRVQIDGQGPQGVIVNQPPPADPYYNRRMLDLAELSPSELLEVVRVMLTPVFRNDEQKNKFWSLSNPILALGFYKEDDLAILNLQFRNQEVTRNMGRFRCERSWSDMLEELEARTLARVQISRGRDHSERLAFQTNVQTSKVEGVGTAPPPIRDRLSAYLHGGGA